MAKATYLFITLLFVVGTQIASSKSVGETVTDTTAAHLANVQSKHLVDKRQAKEDNGEKVTTESTTPVEGDDSTTTLSPDAEEDVVAATVKPLDGDNDDKDNVNKLDKKDDEKKDKQVKNPKKPIVPDLLNRVGGKPSSNLLPPLPFNCIPPSYFGQSPPLPQYPPAFAQPSPASWTSSFLLPPPIPKYLPPAGPQQSYDYPQPSGPAFSASSSGFASASASASANGQGGTVSTSTSPGGSVQTSFGLGNRGSFPDGESSGPFPANGGVVSQSASSHSSSGPNGQQSSSSISSGGPNGIQTLYSYSGPNGVQQGTVGGPYGIQSSYSHSGPNGLQQGTYGAPYPSGNVSPSGSFSNSVHSSAGSIVSASGTIPPGGQPSFIGIRGSFPGNDDDSVAIEVDGPEGTRVSAPEGAHISGPIGGPSGVPYSGPNYAYSGPGYASSGTYSPEYYARPYYSPFASSPVDMNAIFQQYFAQLQAQQEAFQRQIQAQIAAQQQAGGTFVSGGAFMTNGDGKIDPNAQVHVNTVSSPNFGSATSSLDSRFGFGGTKTSVSAYPFLNKDMRNSIWDQSNQIDSNFGSPNGPAGAFSSISVGPQGGYQQAAISPAKPGIFSRFGDSVPPPSGNSYGVFSSSSSSSSTGPDGKTISQKSASVGVNDNGKISVKTVHDP